MRGSFIPVAVHRLSARPTDAAMLGVNIAGFFHMTQLAISGDGRSEVRGPCRPDHNELDRSRPHQRTISARIIDEGRSRMVRPSRLHIEYSKRGIRVNAVSLGVIKSPMNSRREACAVSHYTSSRPYGSHLPTRYRRDLCLNRRDFGTGEILHVDGGQSAGH